MSSLARKSHFKHLFLLGTTLLFNSFFAAKVAVASGVVSASSGASYESCLRHLKQDGLDLELAEDYWPKSSPLEGAQVISGLSKSDIIVFSGSYNGQEAVLKVGNSRYVDDENAAIVAYRIQAELTKYKLLQSRMGLAAQGFLPKLLDSGSLAHHEGAPFVAFEDLRGMSVDKYLLHKFGGVSFGVEIRMKEMLSYFRQIAEVIKTMHDHGMLYVDVKLDNFVIDPTSKKVRPVDFESMGEDTNFVRGKSPVVYEPLKIFYPRFASPEINEERPPYTAAVDTYALAASLRNFFWNTYGAFLKSDPELLNNPVLKKMRSDIKNFYRRNLKKKPEERMQSMDEVIEALDLIIQQP